MSPLSARRALSRVRWPTWMMPVENLAAAGRRRDDIGLAPAYRRDAQKLRELNFQVWRGAPHVEGAWRSRQLQVKIHRFAGLISGIALAAFAICSPGSHLTCCSRLSLINSRPAPEPRRRSSRAASMQGATAHMSRARLSSCCMRAADPAASDASAAAPRRSLFGLPRTAALTARPASQFSTRRASRSASADAA